MQWRWLRRGLQDFKRPLDVGANLIGRWRRQFEEEASGVRLSGDEREELKRLRKEVRQLRMEKEILKKASQFFAKEMKYDFIEQTHANDFPGSCCAGSLGSAQAYYDWRAQHQASLLRPRNWR